MRKIYENTSERHKAYRLRHPDRCRAASKRWAEKNPERVREINSAWHHRNPESKLHRLAKSRAKKSGIPFEISKADFTIPDRCPALGIVLAKATDSRGFNATSPTLDRFDNTKGYVPGNVRVISWRANRLKCDATLEELKALVAYMET